MSGPTIRWYGLRDADVETGGGGIEKKHGGGGKETIEMCGTESESCLGEGDVMFVQIPLKKKSCNVKIC